MYPVFGLNWPFCHVPAVLYLIPSSLDHIVNSNNDQSRLPLACGHYCLFLQGLRMSLSGLVLRSEAPTQYTVQQDINQPAETGYFTGSDRYTPHLR